MSEVTKQDIDKVTASDIGNVFSGILSRARAELMECKQEDLGRYWLFVYDHKLSQELNLYEFTRLLEIYRRKVREWEEQKNGSCCVVERVRDTYLMPKIKEFLAALESNRLPRLPDPIPPIPDNSTTESL